MKLSDVVAKFIEAQGIEHVFAVNGGANLHLLHSLADATKVKVIPNTHECNSGFSADAYARLRGLGCAMATSGPGATNLVTSIAASFQDSVPVLYITGQVASFRLGDKYGVKFYGFQETPIVEMVRGVTKSAVQIRDPQDILYWLEEAVYIAKEGRKGPVLVDISDDFQRAEVDVETLAHFIPPATSCSLPSRLQIETVTRWLQEAKRPLFVFGAGVRPYAAQALSLARSLGVPIATTWGAIDLVPYDDPLMAGGFGTHGTRAANFAVQNADLVISLGSRLDTKSTARPADFIRTGKLVMVDIDRAEIEKFKQLGRQIDLPVCADAGEFIDALELSTEGFCIVDESEIEWNQQIIAWRKKYDTPKVDWNPNPYELMKEIGKYTTKDDIICSDTGCTLGWLMQAFPFKGERFLHAFNMTPMGYGLPAAIGVAFATGKRLILITGDGSFMMSLAELATVSRWTLNIKIILLNNGQHSMCVQTERMWFNGKNAATTKESGLGFPNWSQIPSTFGIRFAWNLESLFSNNDPAMLTVDIPPEANLATQARFGFPIEDMEPPLPREELEENMIRQ